jgi:BMFP domain-containing protein YqiC
MTQTSNRLLDEMARLMNDAASVAQGVKREAEGVFRSQMERFVAELDLVKREDFDVVREMAAQARAENEALKKRIEALEGMLGERTP